MHIENLREMRKDDRHAAGMSQFVKYTQAYPDIAEWHYLGLDMRDEPNPAVTVRGEPVSVRMLVRAGRALDELYSRWAIKRATRDMTWIEARQHVQDGLDKAESFHQTEKYIQVLNTYIKSSVSGVFDRLDVETRWIIDTVYRVSMEPGPWGGPNVKIAHDLMADLIEAGGGPRLSVSTISRRVRALDRLALKIYPDRGLLTLDGVPRATRYRLTLEFSTPGLPASPTVNTATGGAWLFSLDHLRKGRLDTAGVWEQAQTHERPVGKVEPLDTAVPRMSVAQVTAFIRYTVDKVSPSRARRLGGNHTRDLVTWYLANGGLSGPPDNLDNVLDADTGGATPVCVDMDTTAKSAESTPPDECPAGHTGDDILYLRTPSGAYWPACVRCLATPTASDAARWEADR